MKRFAIFGASGCGRGVLPLVRQQLQAALAAGDADLVFVDDHPPAPAVNGQRVLTYAQWLREPVPVIRAMLQELVSGYQPSGEVVDWVHMALEREALANE